MQILKTPEELASQCRAYHKSGETIALVPTMGYYHAGHEDLIAYARSLADRLVVSLFVNPTQFGPNEDLAQYPRDIEGDCEKARGLGADILFAPDASAMYAPDHATWVEVPNLSKDLCGKKRPGHFRGVCTVVLKLLLLTGADKAVFGQKDWQQQAIIRRMTRDLNVPCEIITRETVRDADGLALSSRNAYLSPLERAAAPQLRHGLEKAARLFQNGETSTQTIRNAVCDFWHKVIPNAEIEYIEIVDPLSLEKLEKIGDSALAACAVKIGKTRLIDNILLQIQ